MSGIIVLSDEVEWSANSGRFNWVMEYLVDTVHHPETKAKLAEIDENNFKFLDCRSLAEPGRSQVFDALARGMVPYADLHIPETEYRADVLESVQGLADIALAFAR